MLIVLQFHIRYKINISILILDNYTAQLKALILEATIRFLSLIYNTILLLTNMYIVICIISLKNDYRLRLKSFQIEFKVQINL